MAQQITVDIVAETKKLTSGINDANSQIDGMSKNLKGVVAAAGAAASAFVLKQGVTFLKQGIDEAKEAQETMQKATTTFGEGSVALQKITADADKFGKAIAVDNDVIIQLATQLGSRLPADVKVLSAELVNLAFDVEAYTAGAITADAVSGKLAKAFADGKLKASELSKIFPDLSAKTYAQAEALSAAGKNQEALTLIYNEAQKKYGDAAEKNVTATQKFEVALANFKETLGTKVLPFLEKGIDFLTKLIDAFSALPGPVQNVVLGLTAVVAIGGPMLGFLASAKTSLATLGITSTATAGSISLASVATNVLSVALKALPILAIIGLIVLLVQNWDTVTAVVSKVWTAIKDFGANAWKVLSEFAGKIPGFIVTVVSAFTGLPKEMLNVGINIVKGLWNGMTSMASWLKEKVTGFFKNLVPSWAEKALGISSPSKVFASVGKNIVEGLSSTFNTKTVQKVANAAKAGIAVPTASLPSLMSSKAAGAINVTINAGLGTDPYALGREVNNALTKYGKVSNRVVRG
jgi:phage-related protein